MSFQRHVLYRIFTNQLEMSEEEADKQLAKIHENRTEDEKKEWIEFHEMTREWARATFGPSTYDLMVDEYQESFCAEG